MDNEMFLELVYNMIPYQDEIMDVPTTDDNTSMDEDEGFFLLSIFYFVVFFNTIYSVLHRRPYYIRIVINVLVTFSISQITIGNV